MPPALPAWQAGDVRGFPQGDIGGFCRCFPWTRGITSLRPRSMALPGLSACSVMRAQCDTGRDELSVTVDLQGCQPQIDTFAPFAQNDGQPKRLYGRDYTLSATTLALAPVLRRALHRSSTRTPTQKIDTAKGVGQTPSTSVTGFELQERTTGIADNVKDPILRLSAHRRQWQSDHRFDLATLFALPAELDAKAGVSIMPFGAKHD